MQGWLPVGRARVARGRALRHAVVGAGARRLHGQLVSRDCGGVQQAGNSSIQLFQQHLEEQGHNSVPLS